MLMFFMVCLVPWSANVATCQGFSGLNGSGVQTKIVDSVFDRVNLSAGRASDLLGSIFQGRAAGRALKEGLRIRGRGGRRFAYRAAAHEYARTELPPIAGQGGQAVHPHQKTGGEEFLEEGHAVMRDGQLALDGEIGAAQPGTHGGGMKIKVERGELDRLGTEGIPGLLVQGKAQNGL